MQYLGEFLSVSNKITRESDQVTKYFYYRPERYDDKSAELENVFVLRALSGFPQIGDEISENTDYVISEIDINKRVDDTNTGVKNVSYVVACTCIPKSEWSKKQYKAGKDKDKNEVEKDKTGRVVTEKTPPWDYKTTYTRTPVQVEIPFIKGYDENNEQTKDVVNTAGKRLICTTSRYRFEYNFKIYSQSSISSFDNISGCLINDGSWDPTTEGIGPFSAKTCLIFPTYWNKLSWQAPADVEDDSIDDSSDDSSDDENNENSVSVASLTPGEVYDYYEYNVKFIYDPQGWQKELLNVGTWAKFSQNSPAEQIFSYRTKSGNSWSALNYGNLAEVEQKRQQFSTSGVVYEKVTEPLPLTSGGAVFLNAITDVEHNPYLVQHFQEYPTYDFDLFSNL